MLLEFLLFWISLALLFFCYAGYGILLFIYNSIAGLFKRSKKTRSDIQPPVTLVIAAFNEEDVLSQKIQNSLDINYPPDLLTIIIITDGSVDNSEAVVKQFPVVHHLHQKERKGKLAALKRAMQFVKTDIVVFSDANTMLNKDCISCIVDHYNNGKVGGVAGEKKIASSKHVSALGEAEGLYWRYESFLKKQDAQFYTVVGAAGELFSIRTKLFASIDDNIILDDFITSMKVCLAGYKIEYEPNAYAVEMPSASLREEAKRKIRISTGAYQSIGYLKSCLNIFKYPALSFQYISRRLLRWVICPPLLIVLFFSNLFIFFRQPSADFYAWFLGLQIFFYLLAIPGWLLIRSGRRSGILSVPFYFVFMNYCLIRGFVRFIQGKYTVLWEKSLRQAVE